MQHVAVSPSEADAVYFHIRMLLGVIVGLALTHLLRHFARVIEEPNRYRPYWIHLIWAACIFIYALHFWWWEIRLSGIETWTVELYGFVVAYGLILYLLCAVIFPENLDEYDGYRDYYYVRRSWIFGMLALVYAVDIVDTMIKGQEYFDRLGAEFLVRNTLYIVAAVVAAITRRVWYHALFAIAGLAYQLSWIVRRYMTF